MSGYSVQLKNYLLHPRTQPWWYRSFAYPLSLMYARFMHMRRMYYKRGWLQSHTLPGKTISVGNITAGGTGKTPVVIALARKLHDAGQHPVILSRGYGSGLEKHIFCMMHQGREVASEGKPTVYADEARMASTYLPEVPVVIGRRRFDAAQWFLSETNYPVSHWILEDGFQHMQLQRHFDLVLLHAERPFANFRTFPAGLLRESVASLKHASFVGWTKGKPRATHLAHLPSHVPSGCVTLSPHGPVLSSNPNIHLEPGTKTIHLVAGVADPRALAIHLIDEGFKVVKQTMRDDHKRLSIDDLEADSAEFDVIVTTAKDFYRDPSIFINCNKPTYLCDLVAELPDTFLKRCLE